MEPVDTGAGGDRTDELEAFGLQGDDLLPFFAICFAAGPEVEPEDKGAGGGLTDVLEAFGLQGEELLPAARNNII